MADFITPIFGILTRLCGYCVKWTDSMDKLEENLKSLRNASDQLNDMYLDVKMKVESAEQDPNPELMILNEVKGWVVRVEDMQNEVQAILQQGDQEIQASCFRSRCPKICRACCKLQKMVTQRLSDVNNLISKGHFDAAVKAVGVESTFLELRSCFENNRVGIIGLYGMGGVGKTTLLNKFNNDFLSKKAHYIVISVLASKDVDPGKIQDAIRKKLHVQDDIWNNETVDERARLYSR